MLDIREVYKVIKENPLIDISGIEIKLTGEYNKDGGVNNSMIGACLSNLSKSGLIEKLVKDEKEYRRSYILDNNAINLPKFKRTQWLVKEE
jgi:hypothetical protein|tara:strand:+ start:8269 stop:8541 length:273 start_codon:yes stop_codon:yes gene_type:complete